MVPGDPALQTMVCGCWQVVQWSAAVIKSALQSSADQKRRVAADIVNWQCPRAEWWSVLDINIVAMETLHHHPADQECSRWQHYFTLESPGPSCVHSWQWCSVMISRMLKTISDTLSASRRVRHAELPCCRLTTSQWFYYRMAKFKSAESPWCNTSATSKASKGQWWKFELCNTSATSKAWKTK